MINLGTRYDTEGLPEALKKQLKPQKASHWKPAVIKALNTLEGIANIDELLVAVYKATGQIYTRNHLHQKLYKMVVNGEIQSIKGRRGVYALNEYKGKV